jgi:hypothetical protein
MYSDVKYFKVIKKYLSSKIFVEDGFKYVFDDIHEKHGAVFMTVDVTLPNPNQSWVESRFSFDIQNILHVLERFIGEGFSVSIKTTINGRDTKDYKYCYVSPEKQIELLDALNSQISKLTLIKKNNDKTEFNVSWKQNKNRNYDLSDNYFGFYFYLELYNFKFNGESVTPNMDMIDDLAGALRENLWDLDSFKEKGEDIIYIILEPEIQIRNIDDCYITFYTYVSKIDGIEVNSTSSHYSVTPEMFNL